MKVKIYNPRKKKHVDINIADVRIQMENRGRIKLNEFINRYKEVVAQAAHIDFARSDIQKLYIATEHTLAVKEAMVDALTKELAETTIISEANIVHRKTAESKYEGVVRQLIQQRNEVEFYKKIYDRKMTWKNIFCNAYNKLTGQRPNYGKSLW